ncbi:MAG: hypothetical protein GY794_02800 [bacterium]|nr:hypothetical protein [bacterium]
MIHFSCDNCAKKFNVPSDKGGETAKCPGCGHLLYIPLTDGAQPHQAPHRPSRRRHHHTGSKNHPSQASRQRANMIFLGAILLIGFVMPIIMVNPFTQERDVLFLNMSFDNTPFLASVFLLAPGVAGISLLILQGVAKHPVRGIAIISLAVLPILLALIDLQIIEFLGPIVEFAQTEAAFYMLVFFLGLFVAPVVLLAGIRSRGYRPESTLAYWFGVSGAAAWFIFLILPILPSEAGHIFLMFPIRLMSHTGVGGGSMGLLIMTICMSISALICIINKPSAEIKNARKQANLAFRVLLAGFILSQLCASTQIIRSFPGFMLTIKFMCWFGGMFLLLPAGITDLIVGRSSHRKCRGAEHENRYTKPPDIPKRTG